MHRLLDIIEFCMILALAWKELGEGAVWFYWTLYTRNKTVFNQKKHGVGRFTRVRGLTRTLTYFEFLPEIDAWCQDNLRSRYGCVPAKERSQCRRIWFADPNDAFLFRMRWL